MLLSKKAILTVVAFTCLTLLAVSGYAKLTPTGDHPPLGIEIALEKPFYVPASAGDGGMSAVVRTTLVDEGAGQEPISAVKLVPVMEGDRVKVTVSGLIGDTRNIITCKDWNSLKSVPIDTYYAALDEQVTVSKLNEYGVKLEGGDLKFRVVPKRVFQFTRTLDGDCGCAACGGLQCCPNPGFCIGCGSCGTTCCNKP